MSRSMLTLALAMTFMWTLAACEDQIVDVEVPGRDAAIDRGIESGAAETSAIDSGIGATDAPREASAPDAGGADAGDGVQALDASSAEGGDATAPDIPTDASLIDAPAG
ncbi:MAG TPA: hypothetical protein VJT73_01415 [Polyangiaceae bacterium]|nr:hypothetical protein [Polyangiaceae bacterium]